MKPRHSIRLSIIDTQSHEALFGKKLFSTYVAFFLLKRYSMQEAFLIYRFAADLFVKVFDSMLNAPYLRTVFLHNINNIFNRFYRLTIFAIQTVKIRRLKT